MKRVIRSVTKADMFKAAKEQRNIDLIYKSLDTILSSIDALSESTVEQLDLGILYEHADEIKSIVYPRTTYYKEGE